MPPSGRPLLLWPLRTSSGNDAERRNGHGRQQLRMDRTTMDLMPIATSPGSLMELLVRSDQEVSRQTWNPWEAARIVPKIQLETSRIAPIDRIDRRNLAAGRIDQMPPSVAAILGTLTSLTDPLDLKCRTCRNRVARLPTTFSVSKCSWPWSARRRVEAMAIGPSAHVGPRLAAAIPRAGPSPYRRGQRLPSWLLLASWASFSLIRQIPRERSFPECARLLSSPIRSVLEIASSPSTVKMSVE